MMNTCKEAEKPEREHPLRTAVLHVYRRTDGEKWLAHFDTIKRMPLSFTHNSEQQVRDMAEEWRAKALADHEAAYNAQQVAIEKARATRAAKKGEKP